ncbi:hypothetical protein BGZ82_000665 [Podila clonocystis]|nr:hypothetical protein BGZ82_000665 [Podila clonocystis]
MDNLPKRVTLRMSMREYIKLVQISAIADGMKQDKDFRKAVKGVIENTDGNPDVPISVDSLIGMLARLPTMETNLSRPPPRRSKPKTMYFTDPQPATKATRALYKSVKNNLEKTLRHNQTKETCPSDVRVMFYAYIKAKQLGMEETREIHMDNFLHGLAPTTLAGITNIKRNDTAKIWAVCSEIRGF